jgi:hypothetical protein
MGDRFAPSEVGLYICMNEFGSQLNLIINGCGEGTTIYGVMA